ncbi:MAG: glycerophosphodiester phosphodiesterase [Candidatus Thorarchaeota archaeon]
MTTSRIFDLGRPLIMGHRGDSSSAPENTILSIEKAIDVGIDFFESDISMTKDDELVLFHDVEPDDLQRVTGQTGRIRDWTLDELKELDVGYYFTQDDGQTYPFRDDGHKIITVREVFERFPDLKMNLDLKTSELKAPECLASLIKEFNREQSVIVGSFHDTQISRFRQIMPEVATAACPSEVTKFLFGLKMRTLGLIVRNAQYQVFQVPEKYGRINVIDKRFITASHERGIAVHVWTINDREKMVEMINLGVDGIITDNTALLREVLAEMGFLDSN